jgi:serine phosphatase RsbU (regulator of sigma subunit)/CHASE2 domain-containing sensor protein
VALVLTSDLGPHLALRHAWFDALQAWSPRARASEPVVIVDIDEKSLARRGQWPWPRTLLAQLLLTLGGGQPAAIGVDIVMPEADRLSPHRLPQLVPGLSPEVAEQLRRLPGSDAELAGALRGLPVALGVAGLDRPRPDTGPRRWPPVRVVGSDPRPWVRHFAGALSSIDELDAAAPGHGLLNADPQSRVVRRVSLIASVAGTLAPGLGVEMLRLASGQPLFTLQVGSTGVETVTLGDLVIPTEPDATVWIHYGPHDPARFVSATDVLSGAVGPGAFTRKLVLVGVTALGLTDAHATPVARRMPGVEIHAQLLEGIFDDTLLTRPRWSRWAEVAAVVIGGLLLVVVIPRLPPMKSLGVFLGLLLLVAGSTYALYLSRRLLLDAASPVMGLAMVFAAMVGVTLAEANTQRRVLRRQLQLEREAAARVAGELEAARRIQMGILPDPATALGGEKRLSLFAFLEPARTVGGDLYDFFKLDEDRVLFLIGDVSGKGVPGSLFMAVSKALYKSTALRRVREVGGMMREANLEISRDNPESLFVTVFVGVIDTHTGTLEYCNAGHYDPFLLRSDGRPAGRLTQGGGPPVCVVDEFPYTAASHRLEPGDMLCLVTDGVTEAVSAAGEFYGGPRLEALLASLGPTATPAEVGTAIRDDVSRFSAGVAAADDIAILVLRWNGG